MDRRDEYLNAAFAALEASTLEDLLGGLTIQRIAGVAHLPAKHFNKHCGVRSEYVPELLQRSVARTSDDGATVQGEIQRLYRRLADRDPDVVDAIRDVAYRNLKPSAAASGAKLLTYLAMLAAPNDTPAQEVVHATMARRMSQLEGMYDGALVALGREPIQELAEGTRTLATVIASLADGLLLRSRVDPMLDHARVFADVIIPLVLGLTRDRDENQPSWTRLLRDTPDHRAEGSRETVRTLSGAEATYQAVIRALQAEERTGIRSTIDIASLHGHAERRHLESSAHALGLRSEVMRLVGNGWTLRRLTTIRSSRRVVQEQEGLALFDDTCAHPAVEVRALVTDSLPLLAPIIVGRSVAVLGMEDPQEFGAGAGLELSGSAATLCMTYFQNLWDDERCIRLRTLAGIQPAGFTRLQEAVDVMERES